MRRAIILALLLIAVMGAIMWLRPRITVEKMRKLIQQELPAGTPATRVIAFLDSLRIEHTELRAVREAGTGFPRGPARLINASVTDFRRGKLLSDGVFMIFRFDDEDRLIDYTVDYSFTGP